MVRIVDFPVDLEKIGYVLKGRKKIPRKYWKDLDSCIESSCALIQPKGIYDYFKCEIKNNFLILNEGRVKFRSVFLTERFKNARWVVLFVVTIGEKLEKKIKDTESGLQKWILDYIGSEAVEETANQIHKLIEKDCIKKLVRYSPGYNEANPAKPQDWSVRDQTLIFKLLSPQKIGVTLTPGNMMVPKKSISGIIGQKT